MSALYAELEPILKLSKDLREAARLMSRAEVRYLVDSYYMMQQNRIRFANQNRALVEQQEPSSLIPWLTEQSERFEKEIRKALQPWAEEQPVGLWCLSICGIGPVITAGLLAHIDIEKANTAGKIWRFAGLDPTSKWNKGEKRPWNPSLKTLCWKAGESFGMPRISTANCGCSVRNSSKSAMTPAAMRKRLLGVYRRSANLPKHISTMPRGICLRGRFTRGRNGMR